MIQHISAVTFAVRDMLEAVAFYTQLGFELVYGGNESSFSSLQAGEAFVNLTCSPDYAPQWSGRTIFRVADVDAMHRLVTARGLLPLWRGSHYERAVWILARRPPQWPRCVWIFAVFNWPSPY